MSIASPPTLSQSEVSFQQRAAWQTHKQNNGHHRVAASGEKEFTQRAAQRTGESEREKVFTWPKWQKREGLKDTRTRATAYLAVRVKVQNGDEWGAGEGLEAPRTLHEAMLNSGLYVTDEVQMRFSQTGRHHSCKEWLSESLSDWIGFSPHSQ